MKTEPAKGEAERLTAVPSVEGPEVEELLKIADPAAETAEHLVRIKADPENQVLQSIALESFVDNLINEFGGDEELETMFDCLMNGLSKPREIAAETGMRVERVYKLREKLDRVVKRVELRSESRVGRIATSNHGGD